MRDLLRFLYCFALIAALGSCCGSNDDVAIDNTVIVQVFNLDKSDNLLDDEGPLIFETIELRYTDTNQEFNFFQDASLGEIAFLPIRGEASGNMETRGFTLELDSLSYPLEISYAIQELDCIGTEIRIKSYDFDGQAFEFDENLRYNKMELLIDL